MISVLKTWLETLTFMLGFWNFSLLYISAPRIVTLRIPTGVSAFCISAFLGAGPHPIDNAYQLII